MSTTESTYLQVLRDLNQHSLKLSDLLRYVITSRRAQVYQFQLDLLDNMANILEASENDRDLPANTRKSLDDIYFRRVEDIYRSECLLLSSKEGGWHYKIDKFSPEQADQFSVEDFMTSYSAKAPHLWRLILMILQLHSRPDRHLAPLLPISTSPDLDPLPMRDMIHTDEPAEAQEDEDFDDLPFNFILDSELEAALDAQEREIGTTMSAKERKETRRKMRLRMRNEGLVKIRSVLILSIVMHSINKNCIAFQILNGLFFESSRVPDRVCHWAHHAGISLSPQSGLNLMTQLANKQQDVIREAALRNLTDVTFDNLEFQFSNPEPSMTKQSTLKSVTAAHLAPLLHIESIDLNDLNCAKFLWERNPLNRERKLELVYRPVLEDIVLDEGTALRLRQRNVWHILSVLVSIVPDFHHYAKELDKPLPGSPDTRIPVVKTTQYPLTVIDCAENTPGNIMHIFGEIRKQAGHGYSEDRIGDRVVLHHCDLGSKEKAESGIHSRSIRHDLLESKLEGYTYVVLIMGLFHIRMAAAEAIRRNHLEDSASYKDASSFFKQVAEIRPKDMPKFRANPGFRRMDDAIQILYKAQVLSCWTVYVRSHLNFRTLEDYARSKPTFENLKKTANEIATRFVAGPKFSAEQLKSDKDRDAQLENMKLQLRDLALYVEFTHACKYGDVGRIEDTLVPLIWMFKGNGKHKYAAHTFRHLINIRHIYPPGLVRTIRMNWLANPSGREDGFKGRDLIQELNNNILSNTHSGSGSNHTLSTIIKKSNLIELLANVKKNIGVSYSLSTRTTKHSRPDLTATVLKLAKYLIDISAHQFVPGRPSSQTTKNGWSDGFLRCITEYIPKSMPASSLLEPDTEAMELEEVDDPVENDIMNLELQDEDLDID